MSEKYLKVEIKSEADLPKEDGYYYVLEKGKGVQDILYVYYTYEYGIFWLSDKGIDWFLLPLPDAEITDEEIEKLLDKLLLGQYAESQIDDYLARKRILDEWLRSRSHSDLREELIKFECHNHPETNMSHTNVMRVDEYLNQLINKQ
jgi:hypothetical protein